MVVNGRKEWMIFLCVIIGVWFSLDQTPTELDHTAEDVRGVE